MPKSVAAAAMLLAVFGLLAIALATMGGAARGDLTGLVVGAGVGLASLMGSVGVIKRRRWGLGLAFVLSVFLGFLSAVGVLLMLAIAIEMSIPFGRSVFLQPFVSSAAVLGGAIACIGLLLRGRDWFRVRG